MKKRTPLLGDKKPNPVFSRKLDNAKDSIDSNHVAFPRDLPQVVSPRGGAASNEQLVYYDNCAETAPTSAYGADGWFTPEEGNGVDQNFDQEEGRELNPLTENGEFPTEDLFFSISHLHLLCIDPSLIQEHEFFVCSKALLSEKNCS